MFIPITSALNGAPLAHADAGTVAADGNVTLTMRSDPSTGVDLQNLKAGDALYFTVDATCQLTSCGEATLKLTLPPGLRVLEVPPVPAGWTVTSDSTSVTITMDSLPGSGASYMFAAAVAANAAVGVFVENATADLTTTGGGTNGVPNELTSTNTIRLNIVERAAVNNINSGLGTNGQRTSPVTNPGDLLDYWVTATQGANYPGSSLTFASSTATNTSGTIPLFDAFDLVSMSFSSNPNGATVTFEVGGVAQEPINVPAGTLSVPVADIPAGVTNYTVVFNNVATGTAIRVTAGLKLRDSRRGTSDPVVTMGFDHTMADATTTVTSATSGLSQGGQVSTASAKTTANPQINAGGVDLSVVQMTWVTTGANGGDNVSIYGSGDTALMTSKVANASQTDWASLTIQMPQITSVLSYEAVTALPTIQCPAGATTFTVTYSYGFSASTLRPVTTGAPQTMDCGATATTGPGLDAGYQLNQVTQVTVTFDTTNPTGITGSCGVADIDTCGAIVSLPTKLRDYRLVGTAEGTNNTTLIGPPGTGEPVARQLVANALVSVVAHNGATGSTALPQAGLWIELPNYQVSGSKTIDGQEISSSLTGVSGTGDWTENITTHSLTFTVKAQSANPAKSVIISAPNDNDLSYGPTSLILSDPSTLLSSNTNDVSAATLVQYLNALNSTTNLQFFQYVQLMSVPSAADVSCTTGTDPPGLTALSPSAYGVAIDVYYYDAGTIKVAHLGDIPTPDPAPSAASIVGFVYRINATAGTRFPVNTQCAIDAGSMKWRDYRLTDSAGFGPNNTSDGMFSVKNVAGARSDQFPSGGGAPGYSTGDLSGSISLGIPTLAYGAKTYGTAPGSSLTATTPAAAQMGVAGENQPTSFILGAAVSNHTDATAVSYHDGDYSPSGAGNSFDVFALTGLRGAYVGPDQVMTVTLFDTTGATLYTVDISALSTCTSTPCPADENTQSAGYQNAFRIGRTWSTTTANTTYVWKDSSGTVMTAQPTAADLVSVAQLNWTVTRANPSDFLPQYAAARLVIDVTLRSVTLMNNTPITGTAWSDANPTYVLNKATTYITVSGDYMTTSAPSVSFLVLAPSELNLNAFIDWSSDYSDSIVGLNGMLVTGMGTTSKITLRAYNDSAVDIGQCPPGVDPKNIWWQCPVSLSTGIQSLSASVGLPITGIPDQNPFSLVDFVSLASIKVPVTRTGAQVKATITYTYFDGTSEQKSITLASGATSTALTSVNPSDPANVVGVAVTYEAVDGSLIPTHAFEPNGNHAPGVNQVQSALTFNTVLRDNARDFFTYGQGDDPANISQGDRIRGATDPALTLSVNAWISVWALVNNDPKGSRIDVNKATLPLVDPRNAGVLAKTSTSESDAGTGTVLNRDASSRAAVFNLTVNNISNHPVDRMVVADRDCLFDVFDPATGVPAAVGTDCAVPPGSMFDSFNLTGIRVTMPTSFGPTVSAFDLTAWYLMDDGTWQQWTTVGTTMHYNSAQANIAPLLPTGYTWDQVRGLIIVLQGFDATNDGIDNPARINFSNQSAGSTIPTRGQMTVTLNATLRQYLRTNAAVRAPADDLPSSGHWTVTNTAMAAMYTAGLDASHARIWAEVWRAPDVVSTSIWVRPGAPNPIAIEQVAQPGLTNLADSQYIYPGNWADFYAGINNQSIATGALVASKFTVTVPPGTHYNETGGHSFVQVTSVPGYNLANIPVTCVWQDDTTKTALVCTVNGILMPGQTVMIKLPLQLNDGAPAGTYTSYNQITGYGLDLSVETPCMKNMSNTPQCNAHATIVATNYAGVRAEKYVAPGTQGIAGTNCDQSYLASWTRAEAVPSFYRDPCRAEITPGETVTYRVKLINSGNRDIMSLRFVDVLPYTNDGATLAALARGSQFDTGFVVGSLRLVDGLTFSASDPDASLYRGDGQLTAQYSTSNNPCVAADASAGASVLACTAGNWTSTASTATASLKGDITFTTPLTGGQYVIIEYQVKAASANADGSKMVSGELINNDIAVAGADVTGWRGASSSAMVAAELLIKPSANASTGGSLTGEGDISGALVSVLLGLAVVAAAVRRRRPAQRNTICTGIWRDV